MKNGVFRMVAVILILATFAFMAIASGSDSEKTGQKEIITDSPKTEATKTVSSKTEPSKVEKENVAIEETVLLDQDGIKVTAKEYVQDGLFGDYIKILVENNSENNITVGCDALIVNNYMISDIFVASVAAGKKSNEKLQLMTSELKAAGIDAVGQVEIYFRVYDSDTWSDYFKTFTALKTSAFNNMDTTPNDTGKLLYDDNSIKIVGKYVDESSFWGAGILLYIENNSGENVAISCSDFSINGFMLTPYFSSTVYSGKMAIDSITLLSSELEENGITSIDNVELKFRIYNIDTYRTITETDIISFSTK